MKLEITHHGQVVWVHRIERSTVCLGRSASADVQLAAPDISAHHALVSLEEGQVWVRDLGSTNGTWVGDEPVTSPVVVSPGTVVRLGSDIGLRFVEPHAETWQWHLCPVDGLVGWPLDRSPWTIPGTHTVLRVDAEGVWQAQGDTWTRLEPDRPFAVEGGAFVLRASAPCVDTVRPEDVALPYRLVSLLTRGRARLEAPGATVRFRGANQVSLLHVLGQARTKGSSWVDDATLLAGVWGRSHRRHTANNLHVLIHRVRKPVEEAGLRPDFLERRSGETRVNVAHVSFDEEDAPPT